MRNAKKTLDQIQQTVAEQRSHKKEFAEVNRKLEAIIVGLIALQVSLVVGLVSILCL